MAPANPVCLRCCGELHPDQGNIEFRPNGNSPTSRRKPRHWNAAALITRLMATPRLRKLEAEWPNSKPRAR
jgi:hypothetical protein